MLLGHGAEGSGEQALPDVRNLKLLNFGLSWFKRVENIQLVTFFETHAEFFPAGMIAR
jgi:hypothetical protein